MLKYRNATQNDLRIIVDIYNSTIPSGMVTADTTPVTVESRLQWLNEHTPDKRPLWIVEDPDDNIIGWVSFQSFYGRPAYEMTAEISIYLEEQQRGKGFGKEILQHALDCTPSFGIKTLLGFIFLHNEKSLKLFRRFGFEDWAMLPNVAIIAGRERSLKILGKRIVENEYSQQSNPGHNQNENTPDASAIKSSINPWLTVVDGEMAVDFYKNAFGAMEVYRLDTPDGLVARLSVNGAEFWVSGGTVEHNNPVPGGPVRMILTVSSPDTVFAQAIRAGATEIFPVSEDHGWKLGRLVDPFGLHWEIGHPLDH